MTSFMCFAWHSISYSCPSAKVGTPPPPSFPCWPHPDRIVLVPCLHLTLMATHSSCSLSAKRKTALVSVTTEARLQFLLSSQSRVPKLQVGIVQFSNDVRVELQPTCLDAAGFNDHVSKMVRSMCL